MQQISDPTSLQIITNIFDSGELLVMDREFFERLRELINDRVAIRLQEFFKRAEASGIYERDDILAELYRDKIQLMHEVLDETIKKNTLHKEVEARGMFDLISTLNIETCLDTIQDHDKAIEDIEWLLSQEKYWMATIYGRERQHFLAFAESVSELSAKYRGYAALFRSKGFELDVPYFGNADRRVKENKEFFYDQNERQRNTRMGSVIAKKNPLLITLHALIYNKECDKQNIRLLDRRLLL